jgi:type I restriction enzyme S subunit
MSKLGQYIKCFAGGTPSRGNASYYSGSIPWIKSGEVNKRYIFSTQEKITEQAVSDSAAKVIEPESVLIALYGATAGQVAITKIRATANQAVLAVNGKKEVQNIFLYYFLSHSTHELLKNAHGSGQPNLNKQMIESIGFLPPPLEEQTRIAEILTSVDDVIELTEKEIEKLQMLKKGMMQDLLTKGIGHNKFKNSQVGRIPESWEVVRLGEILKNSKIKGKDGVKVGSVSMGKGLTERDLDDRRVLSELKPSEHLLVSKGYLVYNTMRAWQGVMGYATDDYLVSPAYVVLNPVKKIYSKFFYYIFQTKEMIQLFHKYSYGLTGDRLRLYYQDFAKIPCVCPPIEEQQEMVRCADTFDSMLASKKKRLSSLVDVKKALMADLLTGKVRVKV